MSVENEPRARQPYKLLLATILYALSTVFSLWLAQGEEPLRPRLRTQPWSVTEKDGILISPQIRRELPQHFGDFDLDFLIKMPPDGEVDLLFRKVENWGPKEGSLPLFHNRFSVLRMSSRGEGKGLLTREEALFGARHGGVKIAADGVGASVQLSCRGRTAYALVNGKELPPFTTTDDFGNFLFVCHQGKAEIHNLAIRPVSQPGMRLPIWPALLAGLCGLLVGWRSAPLPLLVLGGLLPLLGGWFSGSYLAVELLPLVAPPEAMLIYGGLASLPLAVLFGLRLGPVFVGPLLALVLGLPAAWGLQQQAIAAGQGLYRIDEDLRLDLHFGPESATAPSDAMARTLRCRAQTAVMPPEGQRYDVLMLGGKAMFDREDFDSNAYVQLRGPLREALSLPRERQLRLAAFPTELPCPHQQFLMFLNFYLDYRPKVLVWGLSEQGMMPVGHNYRQLEVALQEGEPVASFAGGALLGSEAEAQPMSTPADDLATSAALFKLCAELGTHVVVVLDESYPESARPALRALCEERGVRLFEGFDYRKPQLPFAELSKVLARELVR